MAREDLGKIGQKLQTTKTVILAVGPEAKKAVNFAFKEAYDAKLDVSFSARSWELTQPSEAPKES
eukprot:8462235-Heterocapsa_arctica.AAC.1